MCSDPPPQLGPAPDLATLGMFIIDTFRIEDPLTGEDKGDGGLGEQIGGGGTYFGIGARMWLDPTRILMVVDRAPDLPPAISDKLDTYAVGRTGGDRDGPKVRGPWRWRERKDGHGTTRAVNIYRGEHRGFEYLTPKIRLDPIDLLPPSPSPQRLPRLIHCICSPQRVRAICDQVDELVSAGKGAGEDGSAKPDIIWEPIPDSAIAENLEDCLAVLPRISVLSPNHEEAASFLSVALGSLKIPPSVAKASPTDVHQARQSISDLLLRGFLSHLPEAPEKDSRPLVICIRSGALGSVVAVQGCEREPAWTDAFHDASKQDSVRDVTGAGNSFLGGFAAALVSATAAGRKWDKPTLTLASAQGSVSASFVVEQQGLPTLVRDPDGVERWNDELPSKRLAQLLSRAVLSPASEEARPELSR